MNCQVTHPAKIARWPTDALTADQTATLNVYDAALPAREPTLVDPRVKGAAARLKRIGRLPLTMAQRSETARQRAATTSSIGTGVNTPSARTIDIYSTAARDTIIPRGNGWP